jgi:hypothetical protein
MLELDVLCHLSIYPSICENVALQSKDNQVWVWIEIR